MAGRLAPAQKPGKKNEGLRGPASGAKPTGMRVPIAVKYSILLLVIILTTAAALSWYFLDFLGDEMESELHKRGRALTRHLAYTAAPLLLSKDDAKIAAALNHVLKDSDIVEASILDDEKKVVADSQPNRVGLAFSDPAVRLPAEDSETPQVMRVEDQLVFVQNSTFGGVLVGSVVVRASRSAFYHAIESATSQVLYITAFIACVVIALGFLMLHRTLKPLAQVLEGTRRISAGDFSARLKIRSNDEIGDLADAFNGMAARTELFFRYVDKSIAERLAEDESLAHPGGQLKQVSVLFGDMRGFTQLSNQRLPSEVVLILNAFFDLFFQTIYHHGGVVDKTMGDSVMAFFESPRTTDLDHSRRAAMAAVSMRSAVWVLNQTIGEAERRKIPTVLEPKEFGFSVATGRLIVGNMGSEQRMDYTVCGPAVNLAARLQEETTRGQVVFDRFTAMDVEDLVITKELPRVRPKGFKTSHEVTPYLVRALTPAQQIRTRKLLQKLFVESFFKLHIADPLEEVRRPSREQITQLRTIAHGLLNQDPSQFFVV
jgi:adenylate cyclase